MREWGEEGTLEGGGGQLIEPFRNVVRIRKWADGGRGRLLGLIGPLVHKYNFENIF